MRYWDSSALVPLLVREARTEALRRLLDEDADMLTWWCAATECVSALMRLAREGALAPDQIAAALRRLHLQAAAWREVLPGPDVRRTAERLLRVHPLRAADALQLAAAVVASGSDAGRLPFVTLDDGLRLAAAAEGFEVLS